MPRVDQRREQLLLAASPLITGATALLLWLVSPLPGAGSMPLAFVVLAAVQTIGYLVTRDDRPLALSRPWAIHLAASIGLLPMLAIQLSLLREPYVSIENGSSLPAVLATVLVIFFTTVLCLWSAIRFWRRPDHAAFAFLPIALLIPQAVGARRDIGVGPALAILATAMIVAGLATAGAAFVGPGVRLLVPPFVLAGMIMGLWMSGKGPVFHSTSGGIVRLLYIAMLATAVVLLVAVPVVAVWLRRWAPVGLGRTPSRPNASDPRLI